jgi:intracellular sulfur oxidation DsrE/DsrF family protein
MKNFLSIYCLLLLSPVLLSAQKADYKVVFDLTSKDSLDEKSVIRLLTEVAIPNPDGKFEVVMYGKGWNLVLKSNVAFSEDVLKLAAYKNVSFKVCAVAMRNNHVDKDQLLSCVEVVPDGIYEIISKQKDGWGYIKVVH